MSLEAPVAGLHSDVDVLMSAVRECCGGSRSIESVEIGLNVGWHHRAAYLVCLVDDNMSWALVVREDEYLDLALRVSVGRKPCSPRVLAS
jgi:hypothetical protein